MKGFIEGCLHDCIIINPVAVWKLDVVEQDTPGAVVLLFDFAVSSAMALSLLAVCFLRAIFWELESLSSFSKVATLAGSISRAVSLVRISSSCVFIPGILGIAAEDLRFLLEGVIVNRCWCM